MDKLLLVSAFFSPNRAVGAKRMSNLSQFWLQEGYDVTVLTLDKNLIASTDDSYTSNVTVIRTQALFKPTIKRNNLINRIKTFIKERVLGVIDLYSGWIPYCIFYGYKTIKNKNINTVIVSGPPFSSFISAWALKKLTGVKLVLDYRDPWTQYDWPKGHPFHNKLLWKKIESKIVKDADLVVNCTYEMQQFFKLSKSSYVTNGCDIVQNITNSASNLQKTIAYAGQFYGERNLKNLLKPIVELSLIQNLDINKFRFVIYGEIIPDDMDYINKNQLSHLFDVREFVPRLQLLDELAEVNYLYLPSGKEVTYALPFKLFDYLQVQKPIICLSPKKSAAYNFIQRNMCGVAADVEDIKELKNLILDIYSDNFPPIVEVHKSYSWDKQASKYQKLLDEMNL